jgi:hypothetical protein
MKAVYYSMAAGVVVVVIGIALEYCNVPGFCNQTGYVHLRIFDSLFYALHSKESVVAVAIVCNFLIGFVASLSLAGLARALFPPRPSSLG